ncbi:hypothetical protein M7I_3715 [Glarea lozoyensis 74030]|uniref:Uncharacterized protein n=1 Tax=Glarea lozoyensis (strain ATCC 74030 / MF5533) TaxID=1104152 RepID=H0EM85_GLAL7|nr:hypothetical protein M7I_3715 [Glarea lozoyensis 74030]
MIHSPRKNDDVPAINVLRTPQAIEQSEGRQPTNDGETEESLLVPGMRTPARGASGASSTLETVQEIIPIKEGDEDSEKSGTESRKTSMDQGKPKTSAVSNESGSDSAGKGEIKMRTTSATPVTGLRPSAPAVKPFGAGRGKASEGSGRNMTVETEVVSSIPQVAVGTRDTMSLGGNGSIRNKPSSETIRPKKEKKKTTRKTPSVASGTASSKADIFEAKVASAVDEADSSDSEETFVYESNPPEPVDRHKRYHSRTPSATSMASQIDQRNGPRSAMEGGHSVAMKKSMKFANSFTSSGGPESTTGDDDVYDQDDPYGVGDRTQPRFGN